MLAVSVWAQRRARRDIRRSRENRKAVRRRRARAPESCRAGSMEQPLRRAAARARAHIRTEGAFPPIPDAPCARRGFRASPAISSIYSFSLKLAIARQLVARRLAARHGFAPPHLT